MTGVRIPRGRRAALSVYPNTVSKRSRVCGVECFLLPSTGTSEIYCALRGAPERAREKKGTYKGDRETGSGGVPP